LAKEALDWALGEKQRAMDVVDAMIREPNIFGRQSNSLYIQAMCEGGGCGDARRTSLAKQWQNAVPTASHRIFLRRMLMGAIPYLRANIAKWGKGMASWTKDQKKEWVKCPCGKGTQDAVHFFLECEKTRHIREKVDGHLVEIVKEKAGERFKQQWLDMSEEERMLHVLSWKGVFSLCVENEMRRCLAKEWVEDSIAVCKRLKFEAADLARDFDEESFDVGMLMQDCFVDIDAG
jgi:hypothetical protein